MAFWNRKKNWEDQYDEYYAQDRRADTSQKPGRLRFIPHLLLLLFLGALFIGGAGMVSGPTMVEKLLSSLATPIGLVWLGLILQIYFCVMMRQGWPAVVSLGCWLVLTIGGNQLVSQGLASSLESRYQSIDVFGGEPFDTVVVLGGGTTTNLNGQAALANSGDRVALAARLFHAGQVKQIICTGSQTFRSTPNDLHPREEAAEILLGLGVPQSALLQMRGDNTSQEMSNLKKWLDENDAGSRIGLLTSAWHLPRAIRLAESQGLSLLPVPADFATEHYAPTPNLVVPSAQNLLTSARILKEYLARIVNR